MNPEEYAKLEQVEREHWFYAGKREIVRHWLQRTAALATDKLLVDCGAGTGRFAYEMREHCRVLAVDDHDESLEIARGVLRPEEVHRGSCVALNLDSGIADAVTALDVIEHVEDDEAAVREMRRIMKTGAVLVITVPAFQSLWSDWDVALHHFRRYRRKQLRKVLEAASLEILHLDYINVAAFPAVFAVRKLRGLFPKTGSGARAEEAIPARPLNRFLQKLFVVPACQSVIHFPCGVGLLAVARRNS